MGAEPWTKTNAADTTLETKDEQNNPPKRGRRRRPQDWRPQTTAESTPQKRWGRPPKAQQHTAMKNMHTGSLSTENESEVEEMEMSQSQEEEESKTTTKVRRKMGRRR
ncbi:sister chromatid cohesion protein PDS5 homolog B-like isoform X2 [Oncorhynchus nerka]|uniref:sister chromatid cohesion protein PDS5 homolog B-like isoform X2 n=1 Tax=Oncorhynchus nerka TaxID=8023 RepID=UPI0031B875D5